MSNLPPGVSDSMIPGNRPQDFQREKIEDEALSLLSSVDDEDILLVINIGRSLVTAIRTMQKEKTKDYYDTAEYQVDKLTERVDSLEDRLYNHIAESY